MVGGAVAVLVLTAGVGAVSAQTFYVNERGGKSTCAGPGINACPKISEAIALAEKASPPNTIEVEPNEPGERYNEPIELTKATDKGLTIIGEEPGVYVTTSGKHAVSVGALAGAVTVSNLNIKTTGASAIRDTGGELVLANDLIEAESAEDGVEAVNHGSLAITGGKVVMESDVGYAVKGIETPMTLNGTQVINGNGGIGTESGGIYSAKAPLTVANTAVINESGNAATDFGIVAEKESSATIQNVTVKQNTPALAVVFEKAPATVNGLKIEMADPNSKLAALLDENEGAGSTVSHLEITGGWEGSGIAALGGDFTLTDSRVVTNPTTESPALKYAGFGSSKGLLVQRSTLAAGSKAKPATVLAEGGNATFDSSEILGGRDALYFETAAAGALALTVSASTLDAGAPGTAADAAGTNGVDVAAKGGPGGVVNTSIQGSIVLEKQVATAAAGDHASVGCSYSAVPTQAQAEGGGSGAIACTSGVAGNTEVSPLASLFPEPLSGYQLSPSSSAVDSVPASAVALPFGITPSATDLAGAPRAVDGNGDCIAVQDKGALELQGHSAPCPVATAIGAKGLPPVTSAITALTLAPSSFSAAPKGATLSKAGKKKYGTKISYRDSQAATTTFTVLLPVPGRMQGHSCKKPGKANKHGRHCTLYKALGSFTHSDTAGANSLHFSGRLHGRKLAKGSYRLQAVPHNAAGNGAMVNKDFTIK